MKSNYDKYPSIRIDEHATACWSGWKAICEKLKAHIEAIGQNKIVLIMECYHGVNDREIINSLKKELKPSFFIESKLAFLPEDEIDAITFPDVTDDRIFGYMSSLTIDDFLDHQLIHSFRKKIDQITEGIVIVYGTGASRLVNHSDVLVYADMARWEIQLRMRREEVCNLGTSNYALEISRKYKRCYFVDWRVCDRLKNNIVNDWDFYLDTNKAASPKLMTGDAIRDCFLKASSQPFRLVPFFDPGPWGGQWMKDVCDLDRSAVNYAWCFDCVPEENSLVFACGENHIETPSINVVFTQAERLLGKNVYERFGAEFPIRFDFLDTIDGGNLSLQVHPDVNYIKDKFGLDYTQDESYYLLDAKDDAVVYLGLREDTSPESMISELKIAQEEGSSFDADKHVEKWKVKKHDHLLIPAGTVHCSGKNSMVLEISATPYIFTFKLWDWGRNGLDGKPRPINIEHGEKVIRWERRTEWTKNQLVNTIELISEGDGWKEERTGLHETEFIETRRHWFSKKVLHNTYGNLNVLNLVEGREVIVESPKNLFKPFIVHYAETFVVPAAVGEYTIRPYGEAEQSICATLKAFVREEKLRKT